YAAHLEGHSCPTRRSSDLAEIEKLVERDKLTADMIRIADFVQLLGRKLLGADVSVRYSLTTNNFGAAFGRGSPTSIAGATFAFNYRRLGKAWFTKENTDKDLLALIIHEFGHYYSSDHLSSEYHDALCDLGARFGLLILGEPEVLK